MTLFTIMAELALDVSKFNASAKAATQAGQALGYDVANGAGKAASALEDTGKAAEKASQQIVDMSKGARDSLDNLLQNINVNLNFLDDMPKSFDDLAASVFAQEEAWQNNSASVEMLKASISDLKNSLSSVGDVSGEGNEKLKLAVQLANQYVGELEKMEAAADKAAESNKKMGDEAEKASKKSSQKGNSQENGLFGTITKSLLTKETIVRAGRAIVNFGKDCVNAAVDVSEFGDTYKQTMADFSSSLTAMKANIGKDFLPTIMSITNGLAELFTPPKDYAKEYDQFFSGVKSGLASNLATINASKSGIDGYISNLAALEAKAQWSAEDTTAWKANIDALLEVAPELSGYIDEQTGAIDGGVAALQAHAKAWYQDAEAQAKAAAISQIMTDATNKQAEAMKAQWEHESSYREWQKTVAELQAAQAELENTSVFDASFNDRKKAVGELAVKERGLSAATVKLQGDMENANAAAAEATARAQEGVDAIKNGDYGLQQFGSTAKKTGETLDNTVSPALHTFRDKLKEQEKALHDAHKASEDYAKGIKDKVLSALDSVYDGYSKVSRIRPTSAKSQNQNAQTQMKQLQDYMDGLEKLRKMGVDENLIAELSDGSQASMGRVAGLAKSKQSDIETYVATLKELQEMKDSVSEVTADNVLKIDPAYQTLLDTEKQALQDLYDAAFALQDFEGGPKITVDDQASSVLEGIQNRMNALTGGTITIKVTPISDTTIPDGKYRTASKRAVGIDSVPYDGFLASLHEGEAILTKAENRQRKSRARVGDQPINLTVNVNGSSRPYEVGQEVRNALENLRWMS